MAASALAGRESTHSSKAPAPRHGSPATQQPGNDRLRALVCGKRAMLYRLASALSRNAALADDLAQEAIIKALSKLESLQDERALDRWLCTILHNCFRDWLRMQREYEDIDALDPPCPDCPDSLFETFTTVHQVHSALDKLGTEQRRAIQLVDLEGHTYAEASRALGIPIGTVLSRVNRGRLKLRELLESVMRGDGMSIATRSMATAAHRAADA